MSVDEVNALAAAPRPNPRRISSLWAPACREAVDRGDASFLSTYALGGAILPVFRAELEGAFGPVVADLAQAIAGLGFLALRLRDDTPGTTSLVERLQELAGYWAAGMSNLTFGAFRPGRWEHHVGPDTPGGVAATLIDRVAARRPDDPGLASVRELLWYLLDVLPPWRPMPTAEVLLDHDDRPAHLTVACRAGGSGACFPEPALSWFLRRDRDFAGSVRDAWSIVGPAAPTDVDVMWTMRRADDVRGASAGVAFASAFAFCVRPNHRPTLRDRWGATGALELPRDIAALPPSLDERLAVVGVGPVEGLPRKLMGAYHDECKGVVVPARNQDADKHRPGNLRVEKGETLVDYVQWLQRRGEVLDCPWDDHPSRDRRNPFTPDGAPLDEVTQLLLDDDGPCVIGLHGDESTGKTMLAAALSWEDAVRSRFIDGVFWVRRGISSSSHLRQARLIDRLGGCSYDHARFVEAIENLLLHRCVLLVIDDARSHDDIVPFSRLGPNCRLIFTTRDKTLTELEAYHFVKVRLPDVPRPRAKPAPLSGEDQVQLSRLELLADHVEAGQSQVAAVWEISEEAASAKLELLSLEGHVLRGTHGFSLSKPLDKSALPAPPAFSVALSLGTLAEFFDGVLRNEDRLAEADALRVDFDWLEGVLQRAGMTRLLGRLADSDDPDVALVRIALRIAAETLNGDPAQLAPQLAARLGAVERPKIQALAKQARRRAHETLHPLWLTLDGPEGALRGSMRHPPGAAAIAVGGDGRVLVTGGMDGCLRVWSLATGEELRVLREHDGPVRDVVLTDAGVAISGGDDGNVRFWDVGLGGSIGKPIGMGAEVLALAIAGDALFVALADHRIRSLSLADGGWRADLVGHTGAVNALIVTPDGERVLTGSDDGAVRLWPAGGGGEPVVMDARRGPVRTLAVTPDGAVAVSGHADGAVVVWRLTEGYQGRVLEGHDGDVHAVAVTTDGKAVSGGEDGTLRVWRVSDGHPLDVIRHDHAVWSVAVSPDGARVITGTEGGGVGISDLGGTPTVIEGAHAGGVDVAVVAPGPNGPVAVTTAFGGGIRIWDLGTAGAKPRRRRHDGPVTAAALLGELGVTGGEDGDLWLWDLGNGRPLGRMGSAGAPVLALAPAPSGQVVVASADGAITLWEAKPSGAMRRLGRHTARAVAVAVTPDGRWAFSASADGLVGRWAVTGRSSKRNLLEGHHEGVLTVAVTPDGLLALSGSSDSTVNVWRTRDGGLARTLSGHTRGVTAIGVSGDGSTAVSGSFDGSAQAWDLRALERGHRFAGAGRRQTTRTVALTHDGRMAVMGGDDGRVHVWETHRSHAEAMQGHAAPVWVVRISANGTRALSASDDASLRLWDLATRAQVAAFTGDAALTVAAIGPDFRGPALCGDRVGTVHVVALPYRSDEDEAR